MSATEKNKEQGRRKFGFYRRTRKSNFLSTAFLIDAAKQAGKEGAKGAMETMGYVIGAKDGFIVKIMPNGDIEKIKAIGTRS
jgi:hypothetical protein